MLINNLKLCRQIIKTFYLAAIILLGLAAMPIQAKAPEMPAAPEFTNSIGMKFTLVEPGSFLMGVGETPLPVELTNQRGTSPEGDFDEKPNHTRS